MTALMISLGVFSSLALAANLPRFVVTRDIELSQGKAELEIDKTSTAVFCQLQAPEPPYITKVDNRTELVFLEVTHPQPFETTLHLQDGRTGAEIQVACVLRSPSERVDWPNLKRALAPTLEINSGQN